MKGNFGARKFDEFGEFSWIRQILAIQILHISVLVKVCPGY